MVNVTLIQDSEIKMLERTAYEMIDLDDIIPLDELIG